MSSVETFKVGQLVELKNVKVYPRYCSFKSNIIKSGKYYIWSNQIKNRRIRITKNPAAILIAGQITGWVNIDDLMNNSDEFRIGDKVIVSGNINMKSDGSGYINYVKNKTMYITNILDSNQYSNYIGIANTKNGTEIGWVTKDMVTKVQE